MSYPIASMADGGVLYSDGTVKYASYDVPGATSGTGGYPVYPDEGQVLGKSNTGTGTSTNTGGGGGDTELESLLKIAEPNPTQQQRINELQGQINDLSSEQRSAIESGYSSYESELDAMLNEGLPGQQAGLESQASASLQGGLADLLGQKTEGEAELETTRRKTEESQAKNLKDIAANLRNSFMAGNVFLGARGAGDSSAANQYAYALTKLGSKQRGDIMSQTRGIMNDINDRAFKLKNIYTTEKNKLQSLYNHKVGEIQQWFYEQQNALRGAKGELAVKKGQDLASLSQNLLNQALSELNFIKEQVASRQSMLDQWALNNASTIQQLRQNMSGVASYNPTLPQSQPTVAPQISGGALNVPSAYAGGGSVQTRDEDLFKTPGISSGGGSW